jgi:hypothetical protein
LGTLNFHRLASHLLPSSGESVREEAAWIALKERPVSEVSMQEKTTKMSDLQGAVLMGGGTILARDMRAQVGVTAVDMFPCADGIHVNEVEPRPEDASSGDASASGSSRGPGSRLLGDVTPGDVIAASGPSDIVDSGAIELGLPGYPRGPPPPTS